MAELAVEFGKKTGAIIGGVLLFVGYLYVLEKLDERAIAKEKEENENDEFFDEIKD